MKSIAVIYLVVVVVGRTSGWSLWWVTLHEITRTTCC